jgi:hypothetical protein
LGPRGLKLWESIRDRQLSSYPSDELRAAATAAVAKEVPQGLHITKGANKARKIDPVAALSFVLPAALGGGHPQFYGPTEATARYDAEQAALARGEPVTVVERPSVQDRQALGLQKFLESLGDDL